jgi:DNA-directed RNA polymerase specialized sigma24 family protein
MADAENRPRRRTLADIRSQKNTSPSPKEREAMALLFQDGWHPDELAMVFEIQTKTVRRNLKYEGVWQ